MERFLWADVVMRPVDWKQALTESQPCCWVLGPLVWVTASRRACTDGVHTGTQVGTGKASIHSHPCKISMTSSSFIGGRFVKSWQPLFSCLLTVYATGVGIGRPAFILNWRGRGIGGTQRLMVKPSEK